MPFLFLFLPFFSFLKPVYATSKQSRGRKTRQGEKEKKIKKKSFGQRTNERQS